MKLIRKHVYKITFFIVILFVVSILVIKYNLKENESYINASNDLLLNNINTIEEKNIKENEKNVEENTTYYVDIKGAITNPGVYQSSPNSRVIDIINMGGGLLENADTSNINLAKKVKDEMVIIIYTIEEIKKYSETNNNILKDINISTSINNDAIIYKEDLVTSNNTSNDQLVTNNNNNKESNDNESNQNIKISLNNATLEELMTLSGIGESKAKAIIKYREEISKFNAIEDLLNVSGIGDALYEKIKDNITT